jgi:hypothetical protein
MDLFFVRRMLGLIAMGGALALTPGLVCAAGAAPLDVAVKFQPDGTKGENAAWLGYVLARAHFVDGHHRLYDQKPGPITPTFTEELTARTDAVKIYLEMIAKDSILDVPYFDELARVDDSSFMSEYVWTFLHQPTWMEPPPNLKRAAFDEWRKTHLPNHHALTKGSLQFVAGKGG